MSDIDQPPLWSEEASAMVRALQELPPATVPADQSKNLTLDKLTVAKCACGFVKPVSEFRMRFSGVFMFMDNICNGCSYRAELEKLPTIVCAGQQCRCVVARL